MLTKRVTLNLIIGPALLCLMIFVPQTSAAENGKIAFASDRDGNWEIYTMNPDGSQQTRLTNLQSRDELPVFSPDGRKIAFISDRDSDNPLFYTEDIYVMNANGSGQRRITNSTDGAGNLWPTWSPDGAKIAFISLGLAINKIIVINTDGSGAQTTIYQTDSYLYTLAWSPDGTKVAFAKEGVGFDLYILNVLGGNLTQLTNASYFEYFGTPAWSPDGSKIAFEYVLGNVFGDLVAAHVGTMKSDGSNRSPIVGGLVHGITWSPDGAKIAFDYQDDIFVVNSDGSGSVNLNHSMANESDPTWGTVPSSTVANVNGRVLTPDGRGLRVTTVLITVSNGVSRTTTTSSFGLFSFDNVSTGGTYVINVSSRLYRFAPQTVQVDGNLTLADFVGLE